MQKLKESIAKKIIIVPFILLVILTIWRVVLILNHSPQGGYDIQIWAATYQVIAWFGAISGFYFASLWGGWKSIVGKANLAFAIGLLLQSFGQSVFSYFFYKGIEVPYPSLADIGFFGSIPFYMFGAFLLLRLLHSKSSFKSAKNITLAFSIPIIVLLLSYLEFLKGYQFDWTNKLKIFLDFGYPFGQAIYVGLAIGAFIFSFNNLSGIMKKPMLLFIFSLFMQYISDYIFLYTSNNGTFVGGGIVDYLYLVAYFLMAVSLIELGLSFYKIRNS
jgi:hypothetical protein